MKQRLSEPEMILRSAILICTGLNEESALAPRHPGGRVCVMESESSPFERTEGRSERGEREREREVWRGMRRIGKMK